jgi:hypothetical protein
MNVAGVASEKVARWGEVGGCVVHKLLRLVDKTATIAAFSWHPSQGRARDGGSSERLKASACGKRPWQLDQPATGLTVPPKKRTRGVRRQPRRMRYAQETRRRDSRSQPGAAGRFLHREKTSLPRVRRQAHDGHGSRAAIQAQDQLRRGGWSRGRDRTAPRRHARRLVLMGKLDASFTVKDSGLAWCRPHQCRSVFTVKTTRPPGTAEPRSRP